MKTVVIDTNILIDHVHGFTRWLDTLLEAGKTDLVVPTIAIAEFCAAQELATKEGEEKSLKYLAQFRAQPLTTDIAYILGTILRNKSYAPQASMPDLIIAATAIHLEAPLATRNTAHFAKIPHLRFFTAL